MERFEVEKNICDLKAVIRKALKNQQYETALKLVYVCAGMIYNTNLCYCDADLESTLQQIAQVLLPFETCENIASAAEPDTVLFYDGFGQDNRGLAQIYLKALAEKKRLCYVVDKKRSQEIPHILSIVRSCGGDVYFLEKGNKIDQINQLNGILKRSKAGNFFFYGQPDDVVATTLLYGYEGLLKRYQINLTDHAFWLGAGCMDVCIEFREYGASISAKYRGIPKSKITMLPFYPNIDKNQPFLGYPFVVRPDSKVIFSGGSLYKTLGKGNEYYEIVDYLLSKHENAVFWYAGSGDDTLMRVLMSKYPGRLFLTPERRDLFQLLQNCYFYLSTYPICGGLMYQYAACAGKVPLTLRSGDINDGFLLNQESLGIEFTSLEDLKCEIDRFMEDEKYALEKSAGMKDCVISPAQFQRALLSLLEAGHTSYKVKYKPVDVDDFRQIYLDNLNPVKLTEFYVRRDTARTVLRYFPYHFMVGAWRKIRTKIHNKLFAR